MLITLSNCLIDALNDPLKQDIIVGVLEDVASGYRKGYHLVWASREALKVLVDCNLLSKLSRKVFSIILNKLPSMVEIKDVINRKLVVVADDNIFKVSASGEDREIEVSARFLYNSSIVAQTVLLCEHLIDLQIYLKIAMTYLAVEKKNININCKKQLGGGSTISEQFREYLNKRNELCLCLCDSDFKTPQAKHYGETAQKVVNEIESHGQQPLCEALFLEVREIENLIPQYYIYKACENDRVLKIVWDKYSNLREIRDTKAPLFFDMKKGITLKNIITNPKSQFSIYWISVLNSINIEVPDACNLPNPCEKSSDCKCILMSGFGDHLLEKIYSLFERETPHKISENLNGDLKDEWIRLGRIIVSYCCASHPMYS